MIGEAWMRELITALRVIALVLMVLALEGALLLLLWIVT